MGNQMKMEDFEDVQVEDWRGAAHWEVTGLKDGTVDAWGAAGWPYEGWLVLAFFLPCQDQDSVLEVHQKIHMNRI